MMNFILKSIFGGILISLGGFAFLSAGMPIIGAVLFAFGLCSVVLTRSKLFTGLSGFCETFGDYGSLFGVLICNVIGCFLMGYVAKDLDVSHIIEARLNAGWLKIILLSICTGMIMTIAVNYAKFSLDRNYGNLHLGIEYWLPLLLGVPLFIICGMPHCIADAFYYSVYFWGVEPFDTSVLLVWLYSIIGNFIGCILPTKLFDIY